jgi:hypothetical protein
LNTSAAGKASARRSNVTGSPFGLVPLIVFASSAAGSSADMASSRAWPPMLCDAEASITG